MAITTYEYKEITFDSYPELVELLEHYMLQGWEWLEINEPKVLMRKKVK